MHLTIHVRTRGVYKNITNIEENVIVVDVVIFPNSVDTTCYLIYVRMYVLAPIVLEY